MERTIARSYAALQAVVAFLLPVVALAQGEPAGAGGTGAGGAGAGGADTGPVTGVPSRGYGWLWVIVAAIVIVALFRLLTMQRNRRSLPPPTRP